MDTINANIIAESLTNEHISPTAGVAWSKISKSGSSLADLATVSASDLSSGTLPDAQFPAVLPAISGASLTNLNASNLSSGNVPQARKWTEATITVTGDQDNVDFSTADLLRCNNASLLTIRGLAAGSPGQQLTIVSVGGGRVDIAHQNANSTAANRIINQVTSAPISLAAGTGRCILQYDGTTSRWRVISHEQGAWITVPFNSADFTASGSMTWTVASGNVLVHRYCLKDRTLFIAWSLAGTTIGGTLSAALQIAVSGGYVGASNQLSVVRVTNAGTLAFGYAFLSTNTKIGIRRDASSSNWNSSTANADVFGEIAIDVA